MELKWLEDFVSLANTRNFSKSAEQRNVTQPAFSRRIKALENWLGASLIDRSTYPTTLTEAGRSFRETAEEVLRLMQESRDEFRNRDRQAHALIHFAALHTISLTFFPNWLRDIESLLGPIPTRLSPGNLHDCVQALVDGDCDFLLCFAHESIPILIDPQIYPSVKLAEDRMMPVSAVDQDGAPLYRLNPSESEPTAYLSYTSDSFIGRVVENILARQSEELNLRPGYVNPMAESLKAMTLAGHGVAWLPESCIRQELASRNLVPVGTPAMQMVIDIRLYRSVEKSRSQVMQFWSCITSQMAAE